MKRFAVLIVFVAAACSKSSSMPQPPEPHFIVTDSSGTSVVDITMQDETHRSVVYIDKGEVRVINGRHTSSDRWDFYDINQKNVLDTKPLSTGEFEVRGLNPDDPTSSTWYILWWVKIEPDQIKIANNKNYDHPALITVDKVVDADGTLRGSVAGRDIKDATGKTLFRSTRGSPCACYGVMLLDYIPPMRRAAILTQFLGGGR